jgi:hypothetical protein
MNTPSHEEVAQRARQLWHSYGEPPDRDTEIWLEAERQLSAGKSESASDLAPQENARTISESSGASGLADRLNAETVSAAGVAHQSPAPTPQPQGGKSDQQKKQGRSPKVAVKTAIKAKPSETGKPLWDKPHSS